MSPQLSVLLPAYNEAENLVELVPEIEKVLTDLGLVPHGPGEATGD